MLQKKQKIVTNCILALIIYALLMIGSVYAKNISSEGELRVKPKICITQSDESACQSKVFVEWDYHIQISACLYNKSNKTAITCWDNTTSGQTDFEINSHDTVILELQQKDTLTSLFSAKIKIMSRRIKVKNLRRKRNAWSLF